MEVIQKFRMRIVFLAPLLTRDSWAPILFAVALHGRCRTKFDDNGTLAGQVEGYLNLRIQPWVRRIILRLIAIIPAVDYLWGRGDRKLLILSQVI
jgi:manganese transport protein